MDLFCRGWLKFDFVFSPRPTGRWIFGVFADREGTAGAAFVVLLEVLAPVTAAAGRKTIRVWDAVSGECLRELTGHAGAVNSVVLSPDGQQLVSSSQDTTVRVWDATSGEHLRVLE